MKAPTIRPDTVRLKAAYVFTDEEGSAVQAGVTQAQYMIQEGWGYRIDIEIPAQPAYQGTLRLQVLVPGWPKEWIEQGDAVFPT